MSLSVLLIEDDQALCIELAAYLSHAGFAVKSVQTIAAAHLALVTPFDLLVIDINLPDGNGLDLCCSLRQSEASGIVICTARNERELRIAGLKDGADAYLVKPVDLEELEATLLSVHRRLRALPVGSLLQLPKVYPWQLDVIQSLLIAPHGVGVLLSANELTVMHALFRSGNLAVSRTALTALLEKMPDSGSDHRLEALISRLRRKVLDKTSVKFPLISDYGRGYRFSAQATCLN
jgi:DNA-binding response OmpR family regulator